MSLCSVKGFEAIQFFVDEVKSGDFLYFIYNALEQLPVYRRYTILVDNATWHTAALVANSDMNRFLLFNEPGQFRINVIENAFSAVRALFRQRPETDSLTGEVTNIVDAFFDHHNPSRFEGYYFNHLRSMLLYLTGDG